MPKLGKYPSSKAREIKRRERSQAEIQERQGSRQQRITQDAHLIPQINPLLDKLAYNGYNLHFDISNQTYSWNQHPLELNTAFGDTIPHVMQIVLLVQREYTGIGLRRITDDDGRVLWEAKAK